MSGRVRGLREPQPQPPRPALLARVRDAEEVVHGVRAVVLVLRVIVSGGRERRARRGCGVRRCWRGGQRDRHGVSGRFPGTREDRHDRHCVVFGIGGMTRRWLSQVKLELECDVRRQLSVECKENCRENG